MKLLVGLGNPGEKYKNNRHNVGFHFLDHFIQKMEVLSIKYQVSSIKPFHFEKKLDAEIAEINIGSGKFILVKPQTFMNESGRAVKKLVSSIKYQVLSMEDLYVVHDDLDIAIGDYKIQLGKGPKLHNGIESIENELANKNFTRVRIGVDNRTEEHRIPGEAYVLQNFTSEENQVLHNVFEKITQELNLSL